MSTPRGIQAESPVVIRVAGLSAAVLAPLRLADALAAVHAVIAAERSCAAEAALIANELYQVIGNLGDDVHRSALVGLRRAVHQGKRVRQLPPDLPPGLRVRVEGHARRLDERRILTERIEEMLSDEIAAGLVRLRETVADPVFRHALMHSGTQAGAVVDRWVADPGGRPPSRAQLARLAMYLSRAATKTSPYSSFAATGFATWAEMDAAPVDMTGPVGRLELRGGIVRELEVMLADDPELRGAMAVRVNPSAVESGGQVRFLGRTPAEPILTVRATPAVARCLAAAASGPCTLDGLRRRLADPERRLADPEPAVAAFLDRLTEVGLLELHLPIADQSTDPLGELAEWLTAFASRDHLKACCRQVSALLREPTRPGREARTRDRLTAIDRALTDLGVALGRPGPDRDGADGAIPRTLVAESVIYPDPVGELSLPRWRDALADLDVIRRWSALQDFGLPLRMALGAYCRARMGLDPVPFMLMYDTLQRDLASGGGPWGDAVADLRALLAGSGTRAPRLDVLRELGGLRDAAHRRLAEAAPDADGVIRVSPAALAATAAGWPAQVTTPEAVTCYVQTVADGPPLAVVLNMMISGYGRGRSRWTAIAAAARGTGGSPGDTPGTYEPTRAIPVESPGCFGSALNLRTLRTPYVIDYPFTVPAEGDERRIPVRDLYIHADPASGAAQLRSATVGAPVRPVHTGMLAEFLLPPAFQLLVRTFGHPTLIHPSIPLLPVDKMPDDEMPDTPIQLPRIDVGLVTVRRASWTVPGPMVPRRGPGETDGSYLLRVHRWLGEHRIPPRCFVQTVRPAGSSRPDWRDYRKPLYIDFANWFLILAFERLLRQPCGLVLFTEPWPEPSGRACEFVVEITGTGRG